MHTEHQLKMKYLLQSAAFDTIDTFSTERRRLGYKWVKSLRLEALKEGNIANNGSSLIIFYNIVAVRTHIMVRSH